MVRIGCLGLCWLCVGCGLWSVARLDASREESKQTKIDKEDGGFFRRVLLTRYDWW